MIVERKPPSRLTKLGFKVPMCLYRAHLGFLFGGRVLAIGHHGRRPGNRYLSGLEVLTRHDRGLLIFSAWGTRADWFRAKRTLPRMLEGYDFSDESRRRLAEAGTIIAFAPGPPA